MEASLVDDGTDGPVIADSDDHHYDPFGGAWCQDRVGIDQTPTIQRSRIGHRRRDLEARMGDVDEADLPSDQASGASRIWGTPLALEISPLSFDDADWQDFPNRSPGQRRCIPRGRGRRAACGSIS